jgi:hypothetical protein
MAEEGGGSCAVRKLERAGSIAAIASLGKTRSRYVCTYLGS